MTTLTPDTNPHSTSSVVVRWFSPLTSSDTWKETAALLLALPTGVVWFSVAVTGLSVAGALLFTVVGVPLVALVLGVGRVIATVERASARALLNLDVRAHLPLDQSNSWWTRCRRMLSDRASWRALGYAIVSLPIGIATFTTTVAIWSVAAGAAAFPIVRAFMSGDDTADVPEALAWTVDGWDGIAAVTGVGLFGIIALALAPRILHRVANCQRSMVARWLSGA